MDTLTVTWNAVPLATGYKVQWKSGAATYPTTDLASAATHGQATIAGGSTTTYKISNVTAGTTYTIRVTATSTNVNIPASDPSEEVMVTAATNKPTNVRVTPGHLQLLVAWTEATSATGYKVQWKSAGQSYSSFRQMTVSGLSTTTYAIAGLTFGTPYTVRVFATLSGGSDSDPSDELMGVPLGIDYDGDGDGLIDITTLAQLNAIRYDMDGNGDATHAVYAAAFPNRDTTSSIRMGCPSGTCTGYELLNNLDFSEGPSNWTSGAGWLPIGAWGFDSRETYTGTFKGNNKTISNLYISRHMYEEVGLFGRVSGNISGLGLKNVNVNGSDAVGGLVGYQAGGRILGCFVTGRVEAHYHDSGRLGAGGMVGISSLGRDTAPSVIAASYANAEVIGRRSGSTGGLVGGTGGRTQIIASYAIGPATGWSGVGGLAGNTGIGTTISASYATGTVTGTNPGASIQDADLGGLVGSRGVSSDPLEQRRAGTTSSYWDTESSDISFSPAGLGKTTNELQSETDYNRIYALWNVDVDGKVGTDDPWTFGAADQYPVLKYAGMDTTAQFAMQPLGIPTSVTVTVQAATLDVRWRAASYATGYKVQWKSGAQNYAASRQAITTDTRHKIPNLAVGTTYTVRVIATKTGARDGRPSAEQTGVISVLGSPTVMVAAKLDTLTVTWNVVTSATGYKVQWKSGSETYPTADLTSSATRGQATIAGGSTTTYKIPNVTRGTTYTVRVIATRTNVADSAPSEEVTGVPGLERPTTVDVSATVDTLTVTWNVVDDATGYKVQWKSGSETYPNADLTSATHGQATIVGGSTTTYKIPNVTRGTTYTVRVIATRTNVADSAPSEEVTVLVSPTGVMVRATVDTLTVTWNAVDDATGYKVQWKSGAEAYPNADLASALRGQATIADGSATIHKISGLTAGTTYTVRVIATSTNSNVADSAPSAEQTGVPLLGSPTGVDVVRVKVDTLTVTWNAVDDATGYKVQWKSGAATYPNADLALATHGQATIADGGTTIHKISGLTAGTTYTVRVIATRTNVADSAPSAEQTGVPVLGSPAVMVRAKVDTLTVTWNVVTNATGYKVQWKSGAATYPNADLALATRGQATIAGGSTTIHKISGLTAGTPYTVRVIATRTNVADSAPSEEVMVTSATTKPTNVRVTPGPGQLIVRWTEATGATGYKVQWKSGQQAYNTSDRQATVSGMSTTTYTIENLTLGTIYTVRVTATLSGGGDSTPSDEVMGTPQRIDYDADGNGLIDIKTLAQLHAIRWDLNGDGVVADNDTMNYNAAFPNRDITSNGRMGCPSGTCTGYELLNNLDFDENGDDQITSADATYWNNGDGWRPIGTNAARYTADFKGNGYTIDNLTINRPAVVEVGLFGTTDTASRIESVGITNASVAGGEYAGALVGALRGTVVACYSTGSVSATTRTAGGLVGWTPNAITSSYSTASVSGPEHVGGLLGASQGGSVTNSYSIGTVIGTGSSPLIGGLIGSGTGGTASYWDTQTSGCTSGGSNGCTTSAGGGGVTGQTTSALQSPTGYTLIFSTWNANIDGQPGDDDPWAFGKTDQYPVLKYAGMDTTAQYNLQPPGIPTSVTVTPQRDTLDVRWRAASYATGYKVQWKAGGQNYDASREETVTGTRYKIPNLSGGTTYIVRVIATKTGAPDGTPSAEQTGVPTVLSSPAVMVAAKADTLTVTWNAVTNATGYKVQWKSGSETYPNADSQAATHGQATIADGSATIHKISGLTAGTTYTVRVIATSTNINVADSAPSAEQTGVPVLGSPAVMVAAKVDTLTVTWNAVTNATGYKVQWKSGSATYPTADLALATHGQATIAGGSTTTYKISGLTTGTTYTIRVIATRTNVADSAPSDEVMVTLATNKPTNVNVRVTPGIAQLIVRWTEATGATGYKVQWKSGGQSYNTSSRQETVSGGNTTTYTIENLTFGTPYTVRVTATLTGGMDSTPSDEVVGTPQAINYDSDGDGLIDIKTLAQLHAIRWDLNGDGAIDASASTSDTTAYNAAFPGRDTTSNVRMGCPSGTCTGYELLNNLNFDTDGSGSVTSDDTYPNWVPIGNYSATFKGNNKTISNLHINRGGWYHVGLFSQVGGNISGLGLKSVNVRGGHQVGGLVGNQWGGRILGCYVTGRVEGTGSYVGGLVGHSTGNNTVIAASYTNAVVSGGRLQEGVGGLVGILYTTVIASYAIGPVTGNNRVGGLVGRLAITSGHSPLVGSVSTSYATGTGTRLNQFSSNLGGLIGSKRHNLVSHSYWDRESSGISSSAGGTGKTTSELQSQTSYNDIYASWNVNVDGSPGNDNPWTFGAADQYPVLKYAGMDTTAQFAMQAPGIPTSVTVTVQADTLDVSWRAASYATGYKVQWKAGGQNYAVSRQAITTDTRYKIANLLAGTTYTVRVIATKTGARDGRPSAEQTGVPVLGSPTVMVAAKADTLTVTWNAVTNATGYKVQWKSGAETYPAADEESATHGQATIAGGRTTTYDISGLTAGTAYAIRVIATRTNVADSAPSAEQTGVPVLDSPTGVEVSATVDTLTVTWNVVDDATGYKVQWKSGSETYPTVDLALATRGQATISGGGTTTHKISGLTTGTTYTVQVIATHTTTAGNSAPSAAVMVTSATNKPTNVRVTPGPLRFIVAWTEATGATGYKVQWKSGGQSYNTATRQVAVSMNTRTATIVNLTIGTTYTVRVTATLAGGTDSDPSDEVMVTIQGINYDSDGDGLIAIETLAQLHAIRWDLNGDGAIDASASTSDTTAYNAAFPNRDTTSNVRMGCPSGTCTGYELLNNLDFDENGDDEITSADATYWNNGDGWLPIGTDAAKYTGDFKGNGYTIDNLTINRPSVGEVGLFGNADTASRIESVGITNASVAGGEYAGALVGALRGIVVACYSTGNVSATTRVAGGLVGWTPNAITSSYSTASVSGPEHVGGLLGSSQGGSVTNSYSTGTVTGTGSSPLIGGLIGSGTGGTASYWDTQTSGCTSGGSNGCTTSAGGGGVTGQTTSALQSPTGYTLIFSTWNANLDGQAGNDDPWAFGKTDQYPVLKYAGMDTTVQYNLQPPGIPTSVTVTPQRDTLDVRWTCGELCDGVQGAVEIRHAKLRHLTSGDRHGDALQDLQLDRRDDLHSAGHCHQDRCARWHTLGRADRRFRAGQSDCDGGGEGGHADRDVECGVQRNRV